MRRVVVLAAITFVVFSLIPPHAVAEVDKAVIGILGGMQCSL